MDIERNYWGGRLTRRGVLRGGAVGGVGLLSAALIGCGGSGSKPQAATQAPAPGAPAAAAVEQPQMSEQFVAVQTRDAVSLEPLDAQVYTVPERIGLVYPRLIYSVRNDPKGKDQADTKWVPSYVVEGWELGGDGSTMTFNLKKGVKYQNIAPLSGREFTSDDVKYAINRYQTHPKSTFQSRFEDVSSIETPDKYTVVFKLKAPSRYMFWALASESSLITPPEIEKADGDFKKRAIGPGPYIHDEYLQGDGSKLHKNPDFVNASEIYYNKFLFKVLTDAATRLAATKTGQVDFGVGALSPSDLKTVEGPGVAQYQFQSASTGNISWNMTNPAWKDIRLRLAMSKAFDRQALIDETLQGAGAWSGIVPVGFGKWALTSDDVKAHNTFRYDPTEAKKLWDAAGAPKRQIEFYFSSNGTTGGVQAQYYQRAWKQNLGIDVTPKTEDYSIFLPKSYNGKYPDMSSLGYTLPEWSEHLFAPYLKGGTRNGSNIDDPEVTKMLLDLRRTLDDKLAVEKSIAVQKHLIEKTLTLTQIPTAAGTGVYNSKLRDFIPGVFPPGLEWMMSSWKKEK